MDFKVGNASKGFQATPINLMHISLDLKCVKIISKHKEGVACIGACLIAVKRYSIPLLTPVRWLLHLISSYWSRLLR